MSLMGRRYGGQYRTPLTTRDKAWLWAGVAVICTVIFGPPVFGIMWWVFG